MSKHSEETCVFCGKKEFGIETIHQIPDHICPQNFILNELLSYCNEKIKPGDFICTAHEHNIRLKYMSFKNCLPFSKKFTRKKSNFCECASCKQYCDTKYCRIIDISLLSDVFKEFILNEYTADGKKTHALGVE